MKWQVLIATTFDRRHLFETLLIELRTQIYSNRLEEEVQVLYDEDNREKSIGKKRQDLLNRSNSDFINFFDSDDWPYENYIRDIYSALNKDCDCVGILIDMTTNGINPQLCCHSLKYPVWENEKDGYDYVRNVTHFNPVKREIAIQVGFPDIRYGEDHVYSNGITSLCKKEIFIQIPVFNYRYSNKINHNEKYGI